MIYNFVIKLHEEIAHFGMVKAHYSLVKQQLKLVAIHYRQILNRTIHHLTIMQLIQYLQRQMSKKSIIIKKK